MHLEQHLNVTALSPEKKLAHHLSSHIREGLIECGAFELMAAAERRSALDAEEKAKLERINLKLKEWSCQIRLGDEERSLLRASLSKLPRSAWLMMPRMMWQLRKKLKTP